MAARRAQIFRKHEERQETLGAGQEGQTPAPPPPPDADATGLFNATFFGCHDCDWCFSGRLDMHHVCVRKRRDAAMPTCGACCTGCKSYASRARHFVDFPPPPPPPTFLEDVAGKRVAHIISETAERYNRASVVLVQAGFLTQWFQPISREDPEVIKWNDMFTTDGENSASTRRAIALTLSHAALWESFPTWSEWLYVFQDDVTLYNLALARATPCLLDLIERRSVSTNVPLIFMGGCGSSANADRTLIQLTQCNTTDPDFVPPYIRRCAVLCLHAYAIRRTEATWLWAKVRNEMRAEMEEGLSDKYSRHNLDVRVRRHFQTYVPHAAGWPWCVSPHHHGIFVQDTMYQNRTIHPRG